MLHWAMILGFAVLALGAIALAFLCLPSNRRRISQIRLLLVASIGILISAAGCEWEYRISPDQRVMGFPFPLNLQELKSKGYWAEETGYGILIEVEGYIGYLNFAVPVALSFGCLAVYLAREKRVSSGRSRDARLPE
jgi:hypothetical protein